MICSFEHCTNDARKLLYIRAPWFGELEVEVCDMHYEVITRGSTDHLSIAMREPEPEPEREYCQCTMRAGSTRSRPPICLDCGKEVRLSV